jgi:hypothetical protein
MSRHTWIVAILACGVASAARADEASDRVLRSRGLVLQGRHWICAQEVALREQLADLSRREAALHPARRKFAEITEQYRRAKTLTTRYRDQLNEIQAQLKQDSIGIGQRQQLEGEQRKLSDKIHEMERTANELLGALDADSPLNEVIVEFVNARNAVSVALLGIERHLDSLDVRYAELAGDARIAKALTAKSAGVSLGPGEDYRRKYASQLTRLSKLVFTDAAPFYHRSGQQRISLIVDEQTPATFSFVGGDGPTLVPANLLTACGIELDADSPQVIVDLGERKLKARRTTLPSLRLGRHVVRNVEVIVLPPEAADLGAQITMHAFGRLQTELDTDRLLLRLR